MTIALNGKPYDLPAPLSIRALLDRLGIDPRVVAVEHNRSIVRRAQHDGVVVNEGDEIEIVAFVGGGAPVECARAVR